MKKLVASLLVVLFVLIAFAPAAVAANSDRGGFLGFIVGCCFGIRAGAAYNDGKEIHWREWVTLIPFANIVFAIWNGIDGANGMQTSDYAKAYGSSYY